MMADLPASTALFAALTLFTAYTVRGITGFGSGLIAIPVLALSFPLTLVVPLVVTLDYLGSISQGVRNRQLVAWRDLLPLLPFTLTGVVGALYLLDALDTAFLRRALGVFVLLYAAYQFLPLPALRATRLSSVPYGFLGGLVGTMFGTGGPFYIIYLSLRGLEKSAMRASFAAWFVVDGSLRLTGYAAFGFLGGETLVKLALALPVAALGLVIGGHIHTTLSLTVFRRLISLLLIASGLGLLFRT